MRTIFLALGALLIASACSAQIATSDSGESASSAPAFVTATLPPTYTLRPDDNPVIAADSTLTPTLEPTIQPLSGYVNSNINVRSGPGANFDSLGLIAPTTTVWVIGKDSSGTWYLIQYEQAPQQVGWVTSQYVAVTGNLARLPILDIPPYVAATATSAVTPIPTPAGAITGQTSQQVNVRGGPGTVYDVLGQVPAGQAVVITGRNETSTWLQILFAESPNQRGWVAALYLRVEQELDEVPFLDQNGNPLMVSDENGAAGLATPTPGPAFNDSDSASRPLASLEINPFVSRLASFEDAVSAPQGDGSDFVSINLAGQQPVRALLSVSCSGQGEVLISSQAAGWPLKGCTDAPVAFTLQPGTPYLLEIAAGEPAAGPVSVRYRISISILP